MSRRPITSKAFDLSKARYYELKYWCRQYPEWKAKVRQVCGISNVQYDGMPHGTGASNPTEAHAIATEQEWANIKLLEDTVAAVADGWSKWLLMAVTMDLTYDEVRSKGIPCGRRLFYEGRRRFFYMLSKRKK